MLLMSQICSLISIIMGFLRYMHVITSLLINLIYAYLDAQHMLLFVLETGNPNGLLARVKASMLVNIQCARLI